jgi:hypothetical protein
MTISVRQVEYLARTIVNRLEDRGLVEFGDAEVGIAIVTKVLTENFRTAEQIAVEARDRLRTNDHTPTEHEIENEMRKIAADKSFAL